MKMPHYYEDDPPTPNPYPIPAGYSSLRDAMDRAIETWGRNDAHPRLLALLSSGKLPLWKVSRNGMPKAGEASFWHTLTSEALDRVFREDRYGESPRSFRTAENRADGWRPVLLTKDLDEHLPRKMHTPAPNSDVVTAAQAALVQPPGMSGEWINKGGALVQKDWDAMWIEVVRILMYDKFPKKAPELRRRLHDWFSETGRKVPGETLMKEKMRALFQMIGAEDKKGSN